MNALKRLGRRYRSQQLVTRQISAHEDPDPRFELVIACFALVYHAKFGGKMCYAFMAYLLV